MDFLKENKKRNTILEASGIRKSFHGYNVLKGVNLKAKRGELLIIMGESGSGKSTLLSILGAQDFADEGILMVDGEPIHKDLPESEILNYRTSKIGFVYQDFNLIPTLTVEENIRFPLDIAGREVPRYRMETLLDEFKLYNHRKKFPEALSGGEMQKTAILRAILLEPDILLADEPTGNLDSKNTERVLSIFQDLNQKGLTIILVTHSKKVSRIGSRVVEMSNGKIKD